MAYTKDEIQTAFDGGYLFEMKSKFEKNVAATILEPVTDEAQLPNVLACPWFYLIQEPNEGD